MDGRRLALVVATSDYQDPELRQLRAPAQDAAGLVEVLGAETIGGFTVTPVLDGTERAVRIAVESFLTTCKPDDFALVYLSCHGLQDDRGRLWFAASDTLKNLLGSTAIAASWLRERLESCRATRQLVVLDCCFSGAFPHGGKGADEVDVQTLHGGRGSVVLTASRATEYSFEGEPVDGGALAGSVFTTALVRGLRTGEADLDNDGVITTDEAYDYVHGYLRAVGAKQTPTRTLVGGVGAILLARSPVGVRPVVPAQSAVHVVAEAAEIMAPAPVPVAAGGPAPAPTAPTDGPAGELATLRAIRQVFDDPAALETVLRERPVADVVKVIAAVRASGLADRAADVLRVAATVRPVDELVALVEAVRVGPHPADADVLLAAVGTTRQITDVVRVCADPAQPGGDVDTVLGWAARTRPISDVRPLARMLTEGREQRVLHEFGKVRSGTEVAGLLTGASKAAVSAVLDGVRRRPAAEIGVVVKALRVAGDDVAADRVLGWVDGLPVGEIVELVDGLRAADAGDDADTVLQWAGWRLRPPLVAALVAALDTAGHAESVGAVVRAAESRTLDDIDEILRAAVSTHTDHSGPILDLAARRSPDELATLLKRLEPTGSTGHVEARTRAANALVARVAQPNEVEPLLGVMRAAGSQPVVALLATTVASAPVETVSRFVRGLVEAGHTDAAAGMIRESADRPWDEVANLVAALAEDASSGLVDVLVQAVAGFPHDKLPAVLTGFYRVHAAAAAERFIDVVPAVRWHPIAHVDGQTPAFASRMQELGSQAAAARQSRRRKAVARRTAAVAAIVAVIVATLFLVAALTRKSEATGFDGDGWAEWAVVALGSVLLLWASFAVSVLLTERTTERAINHITAATTVGAAVAGLVLIWY